MNKVYFLFLLPLIITITGLYGCGGDDSTETELALEELQVSMEKLGEALRRDLDRLANEIRIKEVTPDDSHSEADQEEQIVATEELIQEVDEGMRAFRQLIENMGEDTQKEMSRAIEQLEQQRETIREQLDTWREDHREHLDALRQNAADILRRLADDLNSSPKD